MSRLQIGIVRFASVGNAIADAFGVDPPPDIRIGSSRLMITFRRLGATRWPEHQEMDFALYAVTRARGILADDARRAVRNRAHGTVVVAFEDASGARGCAVKARWECVVPAVGSRDRTDWGVYMICRPLRAQPCDT